MKELLRFISTGTNGINILFPPKFEFVFYDSKFEMYKGKRLVRTVNYDDIIEVIILKGFKKVLFINCKPIGINIYQYTDEIYNKIKEITKK